MRRTAISILGNLGANRQVPELIRLMKEGPEWADRSLAGQQLLYFPGHPDAIPAVRKHIAAGQGQEVSALQSALDYYGKNPPQVGNRPCER